MERAMIWEKQAVSFLRQSYCRHSLGPWALELGPRSPVTTNLASGHFFFRKFMKGIEPPWPIDRKLFPKTVCEDFSKTSKRAYGFSGASKPLSEPLSMRVILQLQGAGLLKSSSSAILSAEVCQRVGGRRMEILTLISGLMMLEVLPMGGQPSTDSTSNCERQVFRMMVSLMPGSGVCRPGTVGQLGIAFSCNCFTSSSISFKRLAGISFRSSLVISPVVTDSSLQISCLMMRKHVGMTPVPEPLWTASVRTFTLNSITRYPLRELVSQKRSQSRVPLSRQKTSLGVPKRGRKWLIQYSTSPFPVSSSPSVIITILGRRIFCSWRALMATMVAQVEQPSSAPPRPQSFTTFPFSSIGVGVQGPPMVQGLTSSMGGCLSKWPQKKQVSSLLSPIPLASISVMMAGVLDLSWQRTKLTVAPLMPMVLIQWQMCSPAFSMRLQPPVSSSLVQSQSFSQAAWVMLGILMQLQRLSQTVPSISLSTSSCSLFWSGICTGIIDIFI